MHRRRAFYKRINKAREQGGQSRLVTLEKFENHTRDHGAGGDTLEERRRSLKHTRLVYMSPFTRCVLKPDSVAEGSSLCHEGNLAHRLVGFPIANFSTMINFDRECPLFSALPHSLPVLDGAPLRD